MKNVSVVHPCLLDDALKTQASEIVGKKELILIECRRAFYIVAPLKFCISLAINSEEKVIQFNHTDIGWVKLQKEFPVKYNSLEDYLKAQFVRREWKIL